MKVNGFPIKINAITSRPMIMKVAYDPNNIVGKLQVRMTYAVAGAGGKAAIYSYEQHQRRLSIRGLERILNPFARRTSSSA